MSQSQNQKLSREQQIAALETSGAPTNQARRVTSASAQQVPEVGEGPDGVESIALYA